MKISTSSWHYRIPKFFWHWSVVRDEMKYCQPESVCAYFWWMIGSPFMSLSSAIFILMISPLLAFYISINWVGGLVLDLIDEHWPMHIKKREPSVIVEYIKAAKSKVCPLIEYEDQQ